MATESTRLRLHGPSGGDPADVPADVVRLRDQLDDVVLGYDQGVLSGRPAAGTEGRVYYATDTRSWFYDTATGWETLGAVVEPAIVVGSGGGAPAFTSGWGHRGTDVFGTAGQVRFWRHDTTVHLAGVGTTSGGLPLMFTLPAGYRPRSQVRVPCSALNGLEPVVSLLIIETSGAVYDAASNSTVSLDGVSFDTVR